MVLQSRHDLNNIRVAGNFGDRALTLAKCVLAMFLLMI